MQRLIDPLGTWAAPPPQHRPSFTGFLVWRDLECKVSVLYPREWTLEEGSPVRVNAPAGSPYPATVTLQATRLPFPIEPGDMDAVRESVERGAASIRGSRIERVDAEVVAALVDVEVEHTYLADDAPAATPTSPAPWRRWLRVMYQRDVQYMISAEAVDGEAFEYWRPAFMSMMRLAVFADWTAEATGRSWEPLDAGIDAIGPPPDDA